ncbi:hypothetical protein FBU30_008859 [Linnemannia zychae]|nr:hypothetical protein FBU30_008859 [Linnemannia zychae]
MASGQNPWEGRSFSSTSSASISSNGDANRGTESGQTPKRFFVSAVTIPVIFNGFPPNETSTSQKAQEPINTQQDSSASEPFITPATPVTITTSTAGVRLKHRFTDDQKDALEAVFQKKQTPDKQEMEVFATNFAVTLDQIKNWFSNRRYKEKKLSDALIQQAAPAVLPHQASASNPRSALPPVTFSISDREETPSADGILGTGSAKYRPSTQQALIPSTSKLMDKSQGAKVDSNDKLASSEIVRRIASLITGGSITKKENVYPLSQTALMAGDIAGRKYILNALYSTRNQTIHDEFAKTPGLSRIFEWIKEARKEIDNMKDSNEGGERLKHQEEFMCKAIQALSRVPPEYRQPEYIRTIKALTNEQRYSPDISEKASELLALWGMRGDRASSKSGTSQPQVDGRKRAKLDLGSMVNSSETLFTQLPSFTKISRTTNENATKNITSSTSASTSSSITSSSTSASTSPTSASTKGSPASRRASSGAPPLSINVGKISTSNDNSTTMSTSPHTSKAVSSTRQPYSQGLSVQSPRSTSSPKTIVSPKPTASPRSTSSSNLPSAPSQGGSQSTADIILGRQIDFFSSISAPLNATSIAQTTSTATTSSSSSASASATTSPVTPIASIGTVAISTTTSSNISTAPRGLIASSASVIANKKKKKTVRFKADHELRQVRMIPNKEDEYGYDYADDRDGYDHGEDRLGYEDDQRRDHDRDLYSHEQYQEYNRYDYEQGYHNEYDHRYEYGQQQQQQQHHEHEYHHYQQQNDQNSQPQHRRYYERPSDPRMKSGGLLSESTFPVFNLPKDEVEQLIHGNLWVHPAPLLIMHSVDEGHSDPVPIGEESTEKDTQAAREATIPEVHYPTLESIPFSPAEPDEDPQVNSGPVKKIELHELQPEYHKVALPMLTLLLQVIQARRKEKEMLR